jgi:outer membrane protein assembly factor BamB
VQTLNRHAHLVAAAALTLAGCGGGGGKTSSSTASTPAPQGTTVFVIDGDTRAPLVGATVRGFTDGQGVNLTAEVPTNANGEAIMPPGTVLAQAISADHDADARQLPAGRSTLTIPLYDPRVQSPEYGGGPARTRYVPQVDLPTPPADPAWTWPVGGTGKALLEFPPAIAKGVVAMTTNKGRIVVLRARTGDVIWTKRHSETAPIAASPAIVTEKNMVIVAGMDGRLVGYDLEPPGRELWTFSTGQSKIESSPLVSDGTVYIGAHNGRLYAVPLEGPGTTRTARWTFQAAGDIKGSVAKSGTTIVFGDYSGTLYAVNTNGKELWRRQVGKRLYGGPAISGNTVVIGDVGGAVIAVDLRTGAQLWRRSTNGAQVYSSPAVAKGKVFIGSYNGQFQALDLKTGNVAWTFDAGGRISGSATVVGNVVYTSVLARPGELNRSFGIDIKTGARRWRGNDGRYSPAVGAGRTLYIVGRTTLYAYRFP